MRLLGFGEVKAVGEDEGVAGRGRGDGAHPSGDSLEEVGFEVIEAPNGDASVRLLEDPDSINLVVTDIQMPEDETGSCSGDSRGKTRSANSSSPSGVLRLCPRQADLHGEHV